MMKVEKQREIRISLIDKLKNGKRLSLSEVGMKDVLWGRGRMPDMKLPKWLR